MRAFTLVSTVFNEMSRLTATIADLEAQTLKPSQIIITDAGSTDGTYEYLLRWAQGSVVDIVILQKRGCNVAEGRNLAIASAKHDLIVSTDFGCRFHPGWLASLVAPFDDPQTRVVGGNFSVLESELTSVAERAAYICANGYQNPMDESYLPSSRSIAYFKDVWQSVGGYRENLTLAGDDTTFALMLKEKGYSFTLVHQPFVFWLRPKTLKGYLKEAKRYATGDAESRDRQNLRNVIVNSAELFLRAVSIVLAILLIFAVLPPSMLVLAIFFVSLVGWRSVVRITKRWWALRSKKYNVKVLLFAYLFFDLSRINYLYWYFKLIVKEPAGRITEFQ